MNLLKNPWDKFADIYDNIVNDSGDVYHRTYLNPIILDILGNVKNKQILDLACGNGYFSRILAKKEAQITAVDYSERFISIAKRETSNELCINYYCGSSEDMSFLKSNSFDSIVSNISFHDIENIQDTIKECSRLLKNNHKLVFSIPHPAFYINKPIKNGKEFYRKICSYISNISIDHPCYSNIKYYHRPIEYYFKNLFENKFVVSGFREITTKHDKGELIENSLLLNHKQEVPTFIIVEATLIK